MAKKKCRPAGEIFLELEALMDELIDSHGFQWGDILGWAYTHLLVHRPDAREEYKAGGHPEFYYGPRLDAE